MVMKEYSYTSTPPTGRTTCTEPQCLYKGALLPFLPYMRTTRLANPTHYKLIDLVIS